jgi:N6-adenosine-specific RNA methylase IME4
VLPDFGKKFGVIYADPPWLFSTWSAKGKDRSPEKHYPVMDMQSLWALGDEVKRVAADDSVLLMWTTSPHLDQAIRMIGGWGFTYKTVGFVWVKLNQDGTPFKGLGYWTRANAEYCLLATRGKPWRLTANVGQVLLAPRGRHSAKPPEIRDEIVRLLPGPYLELFARETAPAWISWGNQLDDTRETTAA